MSWYSFTLDLRPQYSFGRSSVVSRTSVHVALRHDRLTVWEALF